MSQGGHIVVASEDQILIGVLRTLLSKHLSIQSDALTTVHNFNYTLKSIHGAFVRRKNVVLLIERTMQGKESSLLIRQIKNTFNNIKIIVLTGETERQRLVLLHEVGADNFISKPISMNTLIEKIAFTIRSHGKLGRLIDQGKLLADQGQYEAALQTARQILTLKPDSAPGLLIMGEAWQGLGNLEKARLSFEQACGPSSLYMDPLKKLAELHKKSGNLTEQLLCLERLDKMSPLHVERKISMGEIHMELGNEERAHELFEVAIQQATKEAMCHIGDVAQKIAGVYSTRDPYKAEKYYRQALESKSGNLDHTDIATFNKLGLALRRQGEWEKATKEYKKALEIAPDNVNLLYNMAMAYAEGLKFSQAVNTVEQTLQQDPEFGSNDKTLSYNMGVIFARSNDSARARLLFTRALKLDPDFKKARTALDDLED